MYRVLQSRPGIIKLVDGAELILRVAVVGVKNMGFSPFGGVNLVVKTTGGIIALSIPEELRVRAREKPVAPPDKLPLDGWELVEIKEQEPAQEIVEVDVDNGTYVVEVLGEAVMVSRNTNYRTDSDEPLYWVIWNVKTKWRPADKRS